MTIIDTTIKYAKSVKLFFADLLLSFLLFIKLGSKADLRPRPEGGVASFSEVMRIYTELTPPIVKRIVDDEERITSTLRILRIKNLLTSDNFQQVIDRRLRFEHIEPWEAALYFSQSTIGSLVLATSGNISFPETVRYAADKKASEQLKRYVQEAMTDGDLKLNTFGDYRFDLNSKVVDTVVALYLDRTADPTGGYHHCHAPKLALSYNELVNEVGDDLKSLRVLCLAFAFYTSNFNPSRISTLHEQVTAYSNNVEALKAHMITKVGEFSASYQQTQRNTLRAIRGSCHVQGFPSTPLMTEVVGIIDSLGVMHDVGCRDASWIVDQNHDLEEVLKKADERNSRVLWVAFKYYFHGLDEDVTKHYTARLKSLHEQSKSHDQASLQNMTRNYQQHYLSAKLLLRNVTAASGLEEDAGPLRPAVSPTDSHALDPRTEEAAVLLRLPSGASESPGSTAHHGFGAVTDLL